jgi:hypothetical protein
VNRLTRAYVTAGIAVLAIGLFGSRASAVPNIVGRFDGFVQSNAQLSLTQGNSFLLVTNEVGNAFSGVLTNQILNNADFQVAGHVNDQGVVSANGTNAFGDRIFFYGRTAIIGDGSVRILSLTYWQNNAFGVFEDSGFIGQIQLQNGPGFSNPNISTDSTGRWQGSYSAATNAHAAQELVVVLNQMTIPHVGGTSTPTTGVTGRGYMFNVFVPARNDAFDLWFNLQGTVGLPAVQDDGSTASQVGIIGMEPINANPMNNPGFISVLVGTNNIAPGGTASTQVGGYKVYYNLGGLFDDVFNLNLSAFSNGTFNQSQTN